MSIGIGGIYNNYLNNTIQRQNSNAVQNQGFTDTLSKTSADSVLSDLEKKFGTKINIESVGKSQKDAERLAFRSNGNSNITIAPNILEEMATDPELRQRIEQKIQEHFKSIPSNEQYLASRGFNMIASGVTVHEDGTVSYWIFQDQTPEEKERIRRLQEAEDKEKAKKKEDIEVAIEKSNDDKAVSERLLFQKQSSNSIMSKKIYGDSEHNVTQQIIERNFEKYENNFAYK